MENEQFDITKVAIRGDGTPERGRKIIEFFGNHGVDVLNFDKNAPRNYYYFVNSDNLLLNKPTPPEDKILIDLPFNGQEHPELPCEMLVWDDDESITDKRIVLWINPHGKDEFPVKVVSYDDTESFKRGEAYRTSEYKNVKPIPEKLENIHKIQLSAKVDQLMDEVIKLKEEINLKFPIS